MNTWGEAFIVHDIGTCWHCGQPTRFVEVNFETHLHPGACEDAKWAEYWGALRKAPA